MRSVALFVFALFLVACGNDGTSPSAPTAVAPPAPPTPSSAQLTLDVDGVTWTITSETSTLRCGDISAVFILTESAGLGGTLVRSEAFVQWADGDIEGRRVIRNRPDRIEANSSLKATVDRFECAIKSNELPGRVVLKLRVLDDNRNVHNLEATAEKWKRR